MSKYSAKIRQEAKNLFFKNQSLNEILAVLKSRYPKACAGLHRTTIDNWAKVESWAEERGQLAKGAIAKAKDFSETLESYHVESYQMDSELRLESFKKLKRFIVESECNLYTVKYFADIFRISTANIVKLWEIAKAGDEQQNKEKLLDELLTMRGKKDETD